MYTKFSIFQRALRAKFYIATLRAEHAEKYEIFLTFAPPPPPNPKSGSTPPIIGIQFIMITNKMHP